MTLYHQLAEEMSVQKRLNHGLPWSPHVESAVAMVGRIVGSLA